MNIRYDKAVTVCESSEALPSYTVKSRLGEIMPGGRPASFPSFTCPHCQTLYQVVKAEAGPETVDSAVPCRSCGEPLPGRDGGLVLKYFLLRKAGRIERRA